jgi:hypothetical protein
VRFSVKKRAVLNAASVLSSPKKEIKRKKSEDKKEKKKKKKDKEKDKDKDKAKEKKKKKKTAGSETETETESDDDDRLLTNPTLEALLKEAEPGWMDVGDGKQYCFCRGPDS